MSFRHRVVWSEGMFLRPQHFQQQERYLEQGVQGRLSAINRLGWGFVTLEIDDDALALGCVSVRQAAGVLPDGTYFSIPADEAVPLVLNIAEGVGGEPVCLALPAVRDAQSLVIFEDDPESTARYLAAVDEVPDVNASGAEPATLQTCRTRFRLMLQSNVPDGWNALGVVKVLERRSNNLVVLDRNFIPPMLACDADPVLGGFIKELAGLLTHRSEALAARVSAAGRGGVSEIGDFLLLKLVNHWQPLMLHLSALAGVHPERFYAECLKLVGELSVFSEGTRRPAQYPFYEHGRLWETFRPVMLDLRRALALVLEQTAIRIELEERKFGIRMAMVPDRSLLKSATFVIAAHANIPPDQMQAQFPAQIKIGPVEKIRDLVNLHLPGIRLKALPIAPRELPYHAGYNYFEMDAHQDMWGELDRSAGMALHIAGDFPGLELECWAIRK